VNVCSAPSFMGHEEIVVPMLVLAGSGPTESKLGVHCHCMNEAFQPNDLSNTTVCGSMSGDINGGLRPRVNLEDMFIGRNEWNHVGAIVSQLQSMGSSYAFFLEKSSAPFQDAFIARCRFIRADRLADFYALDGLLEAEQSTPAPRILDAFLAQHSREPDYKTVYGAHYCSRDFRQRFQDPDQFSTGYVIWLEEEGVVRAWTRITYVPK